MAHYFSLNSGALFLAFNGVFYIAVDSFSGVVEIEGETVERFRFIESLSDMAPIIQDK